MYDFKNSNRQSNKERAAEKMGWTVERFDLYFSQISEEAKKVLEANWGLNQDQKWCPNYKTLDRRLGITNSREAYFNAVAELADRPYINLLIDAEQFSNIIAARLGRLAVAIFGGFPELHDRKIKGSAIFEALKTLTPREERVLSLRFGLKKGSLPLSVKEIYQEYFMYPARCKQVEAKALRKMRHPSRSKKILYSECNEAEKHELKKVFPEEGDLAELDLSVRTYNCLMRAGITKIEEFHIVTSNDLKKVRNLNEKCVEEIISVRSAMGIPLK